MVLFRHTVEETILCRADGVTHADVLVSPIDEVTRAERSGKLTGAVSVTDEVNRFDKSLALRVFQLGEALSEHLSLFLSVHVLQLDGNAEAVELRIVLNFGAVCVQA